MNNKIRFVAFLLLCIPFAARTQTKTGSQVKSEQQIDSIVRSIIDPKINNDQVRPDWKALQKKISAYGSEGLKTFWDLKYTYHLNHKEWDAFASSFQSYFVEYKESIFPPFINNHAFEVFKHCSDAKLLKYAIDWTDFVLSKMPDKDGGKTAVLDTKASLLYKLGKRGDAIALQSKAIELGKSNSVQVQELEETLNKMHAGKL